MDEAQITGAASSYARKYALNGLFAIDDTKDADHDHGRSHTPKGKIEQPGNDAEFNAAKRNMMEMVSNNRDGMFDGDMDNVAFCKEVCNNVLGRQAKSALDIALVMDELKAGRIGWDYGKKLEEE
jgi:hypothetical protein